MNPMTIGLLDMVLLLALMFLGMPLAFTFAFSGIVGIVLVMGVSPAMSYLSTVPFSTAASYTFCVMPLFMLMGDFAYKGGLTTDAYGSARKMFGHMPGGLAITSTVASGIFGAVCGSGSATAMVMTQVAWPEMRRYGYSPRLGLGSIAAAAPLAILIPPSVPLIIYGILAEESIGRLFMAGWIPGILLLIALSLTTVLLVKINPESAPKAEKFSFIEKLRSLKSIWSILVLLIIVMGGIWGGICTVNEAAGIGAIGALIIALTRRKLNGKTVMQTVKGVAETGGSMFFMFVGIQIYSIFMAMSGLPRGMAQWVSGLPLPPMAIIWCIVILYLILGCILDSPPVMMLTVGLLVPTVKALGFDLVWFGIVVAFTVAMGAITPPVGINLFIIKNRVPEVPSSEVIKGVLPYMVTILVILVVIVHVPQLSLFLPNTMFAK